MTARYEIRETELGCELELLGEYAGPGRDEETLEFWRHRGSGYVYDVTQNPGTSGRQVCESLYGLGSTLMVSTNAAMVDAIQERADAYCDHIDEAA